MFIKKELKKEFNAIHCLVCFHFSHFSKTSKIQLKTFFRSCIYYPWLTETGAWWTQCKTYFLSTAPSESWQHTTSDDDNKSFCLNLNHFRDNSVPVKTQNIIRSFNIALEILSFWGLRFNSSNLLPQNCICSAEWDEYQIQTNCTGCTSVSSPENLKCTSCQALVDFRYFSLFLIQTVW